MNHATETSDIGEVPRLSRQRPTPDRKLYVVPKLDSAGSWSTLTLQQSVGISFFGDMS
jgi:hypothetical protein